MMCVAIHNPHTLEGEVMAEENEQPARKRPQATGNPFDIDTDPTVPKLFAAIQAAPNAGKLTATDRAVINFLLAAAYPTLETQTLHKCAVTDLQSVLGTKHESTDWLLASLSRLRSVELNIPVEEERNGKKVSRIIVSNLLNASIPTRSGEIRFSFYEELRPMLADPAVYARLRLAVIAQFTSKYATPLYEFFEGYVERRVPTWRVSIDDLRTYLNVRDIMPNWADLWRRALSPALTEINAVSGLNIDPPDLVKQGKKVVAIIFTVRKKDARAAVDAELRHKAVKEKPVRKSRDAQTADLLDGRTDIERGGPPILKMSTIEEARRRHPGWDMDRFERQWREEQAGRAAARDPDKAFLGWIKLKVTNLEPPKRRLPNLSQ